MFCDMLQVLAFLGFVIAVIWIYCIANEIVNLLQVSIDAHVAVLKLAYTYS